MPEFMVAIDHITYYAVRAEDEVTAIDLVLEGQGLEISSETHDAYISEYQIEPLDHTPDLRSEYQIEPLDHTPDLRADRLADSDARRHMR